MNKRWLHGTLMMFYVAAAIHCSAGDEAGSPSERDVFQESVGSSSGSSGAMGGGLAAFPPPFHGTTNRMSDVTSGSAPPVECAGLDQEPVIIYMSADDSNSMASPAYAREMLRSAVPRSPEPARLRLSDFLNYYNVRYPFPVNKEPEVYLAAEAETGLTNSFRFQAGVQAPPPAIINPMVLTIVVDTSYSMKGEGIQRAKAALNAIVDALVPGDQISLLNWKATGNLLIDNYVITTEGDTKNSLYEAISKIQADGGTDPGQVLQQAYQIAKTNVAGSKHRRVVFISDGQTSPVYEQEQRELIQQAASDADKEGIYLVGVATGPAEGHRDDFLNALTESGKGAYVYLDSEQEAARVFSERYAEIMMVAARNVEVSVTLPWYFKAEQIFAEKAESSGPAIEPQHLGMGDSMVFNQIIQSCMPVDNNALEPIQFSINWIDPVNFTQGSITRQVTLQTLLSAPDPVQSKLIAKANAVIAYAQALIDFHTSGIFAEAQKRIDTARNMYTDKPDADLDEIAALLKRHPNNR